MALRRAWAGRRVWVDVDLFGGGHCCWIEGQGVFPLPGEVSIWITAWDRGEVVGPFEFALAV